MKQRIQLSMVALALSILVAGALFPAQAQIIRQIDAEIPFAFYVQQTRLPAGNYVIKMLGDSESQVMEISSVDDKVSVIFEVESTQADKIPDAAYLVFNRYGKHEYLSKIFDPGSQDGSKVVMTHSELKLQKTGSKAEQHAVPARKHAK